MPYATLMVHVDVEGELGARVKIAAELADRFHAQLIGIAGWAPMSVMLAEEAQNNLVPAAPPLQDMMSLLEERGRQFHGAVGRDRAVEWRSALDFPTEVMAREARAADLLIIGNGRENRDPFRVPDAGGLILKAGRPVLVVPRRISAFSPKRVAIAWKDVREARRAVLDALPFLQLAESVAVIEVAEDGKDGLRRVKDVSNYLARHRIEIVSSRLQPAEVSTTYSLLRFIETENIDLVVAGAYGHSRLGELVFGGVTRDLLADFPICCLLSH